MQSLQYLYQIGYGPSSSHTMGPAKACITIKSKHPTIVTCDITLFNSLALTGKGHLTEEAMKDALGIDHITFQHKIDHDKHPNFFMFDITTKDQKTFHYDVVSVGGGKIIFDGVEDNIIPVYPHKKLKEIKKDLKERQIGYEDYVKLYDVNIIDHLEEVWKAMKASIKRGLSKEGILPGPLKTIRKARSLYINRSKLESKAFLETRIVASYAYAVNEENADGGIIVTAPTCGACGIVPAVLYYAKEEFKLKHETIMNALMIAGLFGNIIKHNASISGAVCGCQAEVGSAASMAAAAYCYIIGGNLDEIEQAAELAMEHHLGLTCDPINGYVQIPCIERNAVCALRAIEAARLAQLLKGTQKISFDTVVETMYQTGLDMNTAYKETSLGGLASHYKGEDDANCW